MPIGQTDGAVSLATMKIKKAIGLLGIVFFSFLGALQCVSQSTASRPREIASHARQAQEFLKEQRPDLAIPEFRAIVALDPTNAHARRNLGVLFSFQAHYPPAIPP